MIQAEPFPLEFDHTTTALLIIDMQRDFVLPGGFGEKLGNDTSLLLAAVEPTRAGAGRGAREGNVRHPHARGPSARSVRLPAGQADARRQDLHRHDGPMGRILVRGETGTTSSISFIPSPGEPVIDKPGKGSFHATDLHQILLDRGIKTLIVCGVTLEVCVHTTVREANDRGYECVVLSRLRRVVLPRVPAGRARNDQGPGRHLRLGVKLPTTSSAALPEPVTSSPGHFCRPRARC